MFFWDNGRDTVGPISISINRRTMTVTVSWPIRLGQIRWLSVLWVLWGTVVNTLLVKPRECWGRYVYTYICMYIYIILYYIILYYIILYYIILYYIILYYIILYYIILYYIIYIGFLVGWFWWVYPHVRSRKLWQRHQAQWPLCANVPQENLWGKGLVCWAGGPQIGSIFSIIQWLGPRNWPSPFLVGWWKLGNSNVPSGK